MKHDTKWTKSVLFDFLRNCLKSTIACYHSTGPQKLAEAVNICRFVYSLSFFNGFLPNAFKKIFDRKKVFFFDTSTLQPNRKQVFFIPSEFQGKQDPSRKFGWVSTKLFILEKQK
jgi:hypothetical protein